MEYVHQKIRLLIADDSFFIRRYLTELFSKQVDFDVVGVATNGDEVVSLARVLKPDVITMDYHMPKKNGIEATAAIMLGERPLPAIIMLSAFDGPDGEAVKKTLLASGAEVLSKPSGEISLDIEQAAQDIVNKARQVGLVEIKMKKLFRLAHRDITSNIPHDHNCTKNIPTILVIGASTGGPPLVEHLLSLLDQHHGIAIVVVQHMSSYFTELFAERLDRVTHFSVRQAVDGDVPISGTALVVPGGSFLQRAYSDEGEPLAGFLVKESIDTHQIEIDQTMKSIAEMFGENVCGVLLSGMGSDGAIGMKEIKHYGGHVIVQDPDDAAVSSMPRSVLTLTGVDAVLPVQEIPDYILNHIV